MMSRILRVHEQPEAIQEAVETIRAGGLVVFPTDTVYGVGAALERRDGVARLYVAKGRPLERAIPVLVSNFEIAGKLASRLDEASLRLMRTFWPGPLTVVLPAQEWLPREIVRETGSVGLRMPDHSVALELIERSGGALATTSANRSGEAETTTAREADRAIGKNVDLILDGGTTPGGVASTVVRVEDRDVQILRYGAIAERQIRNAIGNLVPRHDMPGSPRKNAKFRGERKGS